jgi:hypothetical protein
LSSIIPIRSNLPLERGGKSGIFSEDERSRIKNKFPALGLDIILQMASDAAFQKEDMKITLFSL